jgi:hypothetical protein
MHFLGWNCSSERRQVRLCTRIIESQPKRNFGPPETWTQPRNGDRDIAIYGWTIGQGEINATLTDEISTRCDENHRASHHPRFLALQYHLDRSAPRSNGKGHVEENGDQVMRNDAKTTQNRIAGIRK